jgi:flagellar basal-body rod protein FlgB
LVLAGPGQKLPQAGGGGGLRSLRTSQIIHHQIGMPVARALAPAVLNAIRMIEALFQSTNYQIARQMMDATVMRQQAIAANIANAETPGYKRVDLAPSFASQLQAAMQRGPGEMQKLQPQLVEDPTAKAMRPDGNNVEIESELTLLGRNSTEYNFLAQVVTGNIRSLRTAITGKSG